MITLDYIQHDKAKKSIQEILEEKNATDGNISDLHITTDSGYVIYTVSLGGEKSFSVFDCGVVFDRKD